MKFAISFLLIIGHVLASPIDLAHEAQIEGINALKVILIKTYKIPENLIGIRSVGSCESVQANGKMSLCLKKNGDLITVSVNQRFIQESLKIFQAP
jgi:hypothetical protein